MTSSETASTALPVEKAEEAEQHKAKLNDFRLSCKVKPLGNNSWLEWSSASESTRHYLEHKVDAVAVLLKVISTANASHLWDALQKSKLVHKKLNINSLSLPSEKKYLKALAEAYMIASSWDTRRHFIYYGRSGKLQCCLWIHPWSQFLWIHCCKSTLSPTRPWSPCSCRAEYPPSCYKKSVGSLSRIYNQPPLGSRSSLWWEDTCSVHWRVSSGAKCYQNDDTTANCTAVQTFLRGNRVCPIQLEHDVTHSFSVHCLGL